MTLTDVRNIINNAGGDSVVLGFIFDNISKKLYEKGEFVFENAFIDFGNGSEVIKMGEKDQKGIEYFVYKHVETIQAVLTVNDSEDINRIDRRYTFA